MSYRAFKKLLGETSLERKCRFFFGAFILVLIAASFWFYARQTEHLAYDQIPTSCRLLVNHIVARQVATACRKPLEEMPSALTPAVLGAVFSAGPGGPLKVLVAWELRAAEAAGEWRTQAQDQFRQRWEEPWPETLKNYNYVFLTPSATKRENRPDSDFAQERLKEFLADKSKNEDSQLLLARHEHHYYGAIRASKSCLECHQRMNADLKEGGLIAVVKITVPTRSIEDGVHVNRAVLLCTALVTALLIMGGSYIIVRYVIVKPVKHLKEVSDAISAGELNVRSEIQTGDEFEDLSHAFNRMLRNLVAMQDRLRKVNGDLDRKVDELAQANLKLYETSQLKGDFLATVSHELRTPLNSILGFSDVLLSGDQLNDKQKKWVRNIQSSGGQLLALINDILDLAKIEAGKMEVRVGDFSVYELCEAMLAMFRLSAEQKNIDLRSQLDPGMPTLRQDSGKLQQILQNLLSNAIKFTPEGGRVLLRACPAPPRSNGMVPADGYGLKVTAPGTLAAASSADILLVVSDTGVGITAEERELVFEKFRQGANVLTREHRGTGLGLSITRELTRLLGGEVTLQSEVGRGSTFTVRLPMFLNPGTRSEFDLPSESVDLARPQHGLALRPATVSETIR